ncbi:MAG: hypothetical protein Q7J73_09790 [Dehalococcoidales bacterium]|nr:hypothetical protein [Dehalococcoidales bacterium]
MAYLPLLTSIVSFIFAVTVLDQYFARRKSFQLLWAIGLFMYSVAAFTEFYAEMYGVTDIILRLWYLIGAILVAAYMGMGTLYLLMRRRNAHIVMAVLGMASVYAAIRILTVNIDVTGLTALTGKGVMPVDVRAILAPIFNAFGTFALVGGAIYSSYVFWRKRILPHRVSSNVLIAVGALLPALGGTHLTFVGNLNILLIFELAGVIVMFIGFLRTKEVFGLYRFPLVHGFKKTEKDSTAR